MPALAKRGAIIEAGARKIPRHSGPGQCCFGQPRKVHKTMKYNAKNFQADFFANAHEQIR